MTGIARLPLVLIAVAWLAVACGSTPKVDPAATTLITCPGVPIDRCDAAVASARRSLPHEVMVEIQVNCVSTPCSAASGTITTTVILADGRRLDTEPLSWFDPTATNDGNLDTPPPGKPPPDGLPVEPICQGVALDMCRQMASGTGEDGHGVVVSILVRCKAICTNQSGEGQTIWTFEDGSQSTSEWGYANAG